MVRRHELSDEEWAKLAPLLQHTATPGRYYRDDRQVLNGMLYWLHTGVPWRDLPERYGPWPTVYSRFCRWSRNGLWDRILSSLQRELDALGEIEWSAWCIDGTNIRAHRAAAGGGKKPSPHGARRSRFGTKPRRIRLEAPSAHGRATLAAGRSSERGPSQ